MLNRIFTFGLCVAGAAAAGLALGADLVWSGSPGFGPAQLVLLLAGLATFSIGLDVRPAVVRETLAGVLARPREHGIAFLKYGAILLQLVLMVVVVRQFQIETTSFHDVIALLVVAGFAVHYLLPASARLVFFALLSLSAVWIVFGVLGAPWLIGIGLGLIGICHAPISFRARLVLLLTAGVLLAVLRGEWYQAPFPSAIWPILGSMFMFRLIVYMHDLRHSKEPFDWRRSVAYFFLLPNVVFPLFPVVDWSMFRRTYYDRERHWIYQRGVQWIFRGITHLLLYRLVYQTMLIPAEQVGSILDLGRFMLATFLLYLRVSGQFHLIIGLLHLFGFRLPETHRLFYLASSFTDFWRRINIYWKDFMLKVVFYPSHFRLKRFGQTTRMVVAMLLVFLATWALHVYQWFWLLGEVLLTWPDVLFWTILAFLLIANSLYEIRRGRKRTLGKARVSMSTMAPRALSTAATFVAICILWSFWSSHSIEDWVSLWGVLGEADGGGSRLTGPLGIVVVAIGMVASAGPREPPREAGPEGPRIREPSFAGVAVRTLAAAVLMVALSTPAIVARLGATVGGTLRDLRTPQLSMVDQEVMRRGYYENLTAPNPLNAALFEVYASRPGQVAWPNVMQAGLARLTGDALHWELLPLRGAEYHGVVLRTNRWGMRDRDYEKAKPPNTYRVAVLGASYVMGDGVADHQTFENLLEARLAAERETDEPHVEILNFATPNHMPLRHLVLLHRKGFEFEPDAVFMISHSSDRADIPHVIASAIEELDTPPLAFLRPLLDSLGIDLTLPRLELTRSLSPYADVLLEHTYVHIVADLRERGILPVWVYVPTPNVDPATPRMTTQMAMAFRAGFTVINLRNVYAHTDPRRLWIAEWDYHPNAEGHQLIADKLYTALRSRSDRIPLRGDVRPFPAIPLVDEILLSTGDTMKPVANPETRAGLK